MKKKIEYLTNLYEQGKLDKDEFVKAVSMLNTKKTGDKKKNSKNNWKIFKFVFLVSTILGLLVGNHFINAITSGIIWALFAEFLSRVLKK